MDSLDTPSVSLGLFIILTLIIGNGIFAMTEKAVLSIRRAKLEKQADTGDKKAKRILDLIDEPNKVLLALQLGITLIGILIGILTTAELMPAFSYYVENIPFLNEYSTIISWTIAIASTMFFTLIFGELFPKKIAENKPESVVKFMAKPLEIFLNISTPFISLLSFISNLILSFLGLKEKKEFTVTEDEVRTLIEQGTEEGTFEKTEQDMVDKVFRLGDQNAYALMTPRTQMLWLDLEESLDENLKIIKDNEDTTFPVGRGSLDDFVGVLHTKDLLLDILDGEEINLEQCIRTPIFVPKSMQSFKVLETLKDASIHEAIVLDEFGGVVGFITMQDIVSEIVGDISLGQDEEEKQIISREDGSWLVDGLLSIDDFKEYFDLDELPDEDEDHYQTMGGFVTSYLDYIPSPTEKFIWNDFIFEVIDMDRARVDKILVTKRAKENIA